MKRDPRQRLFPVSAAPSPCVRNCCLDEQNICLGCFRHLDEITAWGGSSDPERRAILERAAQRRYAGQAGAALHDPEPL